MTPRHKIIATLGAFAVILMMFVAFILFPLIRSIRSDSDRVFAARQELSQVSMYEAQIQKFNELFQTRERDISALRNLFVDRATPIVFIEFLETSSQDSRVSLKINPVEFAQSKKDVWDSVDFELTGKGAFPHVLSFMKQLEYSPYLLEFKNVILQRWSTGDIDFSFLLKVYTR